MNKRDLHNTPYIAGCMPILISPVGAHDPDEKIVYFFYIFREELNKEQTNAIIFITLHDYWVQLSNF